MKVIYIAGPFRGPNHWAIAENIRNAERAALEVWRMGAAAICPHANTAHFQDAAPDDIWLKGDLEILRRCDGILMLPTYKESKGATAEMQEALTLGMPVFFDHTQLKDWLDSYVVPSPEPHKIFYHKGILRHGDSPGC